MFGFCISIYFDICSIYEKIYDSMNNVTSYIYIQYMCNKVTKLSHLNWCGSLLYMTNIFEVLGVILTVDIKYTLLLQCDTEKNGRK